MKIVTKLRACTAPVLVLMATAAIAQSQGDMKKADNKWKMSVGLSAFSIESDNATNQGLGESAFGVDIAGNYYFNPHLVTSLGFGMVRIKDNEKFTQQVIVTDLFGSEFENAKSSVTSIPLFAEVSYRSLAASDNGFGLRLGAGLTRFVRTERSISKCSDCRSDDLSIDGGAYVTAGAFYNRSNSSKFGVSAKQYVAGDVKTNILFWLELN